MTLTATPAWSSRCCSLRPLHLHPLLLPPPPPSTSLRLTPMMRMNPSHSLPPPPPKSNNHRLSSTTSATFHFRRELNLKAAFAVLLSNVAAEITTTQFSIGNWALASSTLPPISSTKSWEEFVGDGFSVRIPPGFDDIMEDEDYTAGTSLYGDRAKPKTYAARFASSDRSEIVSVVIRPSNRLKITFLEANDISVMGSLREAARIFVPVGAVLQYAQRIKIKKEEGIRTYYFYEFTLEEQHVALVASLQSGKVFVAASTAPESRWEEDGVMLRSAAVSFAIL